MEMTSEQFAALTAKGLTAKFRQLDGFAAACFDDNSVEDLMEFDTATPDAADMAAWNINESEWRLAQRMALELAMDIFADQKPL